MTASEIIKEFQALPQEERRSVATFILTEDKSWIPDSFRQGMAEAEAGKLFDIDMVLNDKPPAEL
jgi:predicted transcriptional regulator